MKNGLTRALGKAGLKLKKHSPELLVAVGIVGSVVSTVIACKATLKVNELLEEDNKNLEKIHEMHDKKHPRYSEKDYKMDLVKAYTKAGAKLAVNYAPAIAVGAFSYGCIIGSNRILNKRYAGMAAAYAGVDQLFKKYRGKVVEQFGEDVDQQLYYDYKVEEIERTETKEDGTTETKTEVVNNLKGLDPSQYSVYAKFFDESNPNWTKSAEYNMTFLKGVQSACTNKLIATGHLFLNEVYDMLGIERTGIGQCVGWIYDAKHPIGDNYVDFGLYDETKSRARAFVNGTENVILLDFNVDGNILDMI